MILIFYFHYIHPSFHLKHTLILSFNYSMSKPSILSLKPSTLHFSSLDFKFFSLEPAFSFYFLYLIAWLYFCLLFIIMLNFVFSFQETLLFFFFNLFICMRTYALTISQNYRGESPYHFPGNGRLCPAWLLFPSMYFPIMF